MLHINLQYNSPETHIRDNNLDRFSIIFAAFGFRISRADLTFMRFLFETEEGRCTEEVIVFLLEGKSFVWLLTETSDILTGFPYSVSRIRKASV